MKIRITPKYKNNCLPNVFNVIVNDVRVATVQGIDYKHIQVMGGVNIKIKYHINRPSYPIGLNFTISKPDNFEEFDYVNALLKKMINSKRIRDLLNDYYRHATSQ